MHNKVTREKYITKYMQVQNIITDLHVFKNLRIIIIQSKKQKENKYIF